MRRWTDHSKIPNTNNGYYARWRYAEPNVAWTTPGGDLNPTAMGSRPAGSGGFSPHWQRINLTPAVVEDWIRNPAANFGMMLRNESSVNDGVTYYGAEHSESSLRPKLTIVYSSDPVSVRDNFSSAPAGGLRPQLGARAAITAVPLFTVDGRAVDTRIRSGGIHTLLDLGRMASRVYVAPLPLVEAEGQ